MSTNCRPLDEMNESEARDYVRHLIGHIERRKAEQKEYQTWQDGRGTPTEAQIAQSGLLDDAILEVLKRLVVS